MYLKLCGWEKQNVCVFLNRSETFGWKKLPFKITILICQWFCVWQEHNEQQIKYSSNMDGQSCQFQSGDNLNTNL